MKGDLNVPNRITLARILLIPVFIIALTEGAYRAALLIGCGMFLTDALDGWLARRWKQKTRLGAFLDPTADKLLLLSTYGVLAHRGDIPEWLFVVVVSRDVAVVVGWALMFILHKTADPMTRWLGKCATAAQMGYATLVLLGRAFELEGGFWSSLMTFFQAGTVVFTAASLLDYLRFGSQKLGKD